MPLEATCQILPYIIHPRAILTLAAIACKHVVNYARFSAILTSLKCCGWHANAFLPLAHLTVQQSSLAKLGVDKLHR